MTRLLFSLLAVTLLTGVCNGEEVKTKASWYSTQESKARCADGSALNDNALTCASWCYPLSTWIKVEHEGRAVVVKVTDRGPGKKALSRGVTLDLSKRAFSELAGLEQGVIQVKVSQVQ